MNPELFSKTLEFSKKLRQDIQNSKPSQPNYPSSPQDLIKRAEPLIKALYRGRSKLVNKTTPQNYSE